MMSTVSRPAVISSVSKIRGRGPTELTRRWTSVSGSPGQGEALDQLGEAVEGAVDLVDLRAGREVQLRERATAAQQRVVEDRRVSANHAGALQAIHASLRRGGGEVDHPADLAG
jgi:hypothetical protein